MQEGEELKQKLIHLFESQRLAVLSTHSEGQPYGSLVAFISSRDLREFLFVTPRATRKYANLKADPRVALLIDSRSNQDSDIHRAMAVTAVGQAAEVTEEERETVLKRYLAKHPHLEDFARSPSCALVCVTVESFYIVNRFQKVMELHLTA